MLNDSVPTADETGKGTNWRVIIFVDECDTKEPTLTSRRSRVESPLYYKQNAFVEKIPNEWLRLH